MSQIKASCQSILLPIILFGCPKCALLNPTQAPPWAMATRSNGSLGSVAAQSFCPVPYTLRRAIPPSEKARGHSYFLLEKVAACRLSTTQPSTTCLLCFSNTPTLLPQGLCTYHSFVLEQISQLSKRLLFLGLTFSAMVSERLFLSLSSFLFPALPGSAWFPRFGVSPLPYLLQSSSHSLKLTCHFICLSPCWYQSLRTRV